jgi:hypothetical protein
VKEQLFNDNFSEALFKQAVIDDFEREIVKMQEDKTPVTFSVRHERRMNALFAKERRRAKVHSFLTSARHVAAAFAVFVVLSIGLMAVPAVRAAVGTAILWLDEYAQFSGGTSVEREFGEPSVLPAGFSEMSRIEEAGFVSINYTNADGVMLMFTCTPENDSLSVNNEGVEYGQLAVDGTIYHTFTAISGEYISSVVWDMGGSRFCIGAKLPIEDLLTVAQSVY